MRVPATALCFCVIQLALCAIAASALRAQFQGRPVRSRLSAPSSPVYNYTVRWFDQFADHFSYENSTFTYPQRYLINDEYWQRPTPDNNFTAGPMFFYTGNEGDIELFAGNSGFIWETAPQFNALLVFAEHRYYGQSLPFGSLSYAAVDNLRLLTAEQALADYATLIQALKAEYLPAESNGEMPVVLFGGSYGGMLAAWFRVKYPHLAIGAIASSAPIWSMVGQMSDESFAALCTHDFALYGAACPKGIRRTWDILAEWSVDPIGLAKINSIFSPCQLLSAENVTTELYEWIYSALTYLPMANYPYPASFLGELPAWPVQVACSFFKDGQDDLATLIALRNAMNMFYNYTGESGACFQVSNPEPSTMTDLNGWGYQTCTEVVQPFGQDGVHDLFYPAPWNLSSAMANCELTYGITPRPYWIPTQFAGYDLAESGASNIVFSNGDMDPWSGGGVLRNLSDSLVSFLIENGAHHLDLRASNPLDPPSVLAARQFHRTFIQRWIDQYRSASTSPSSDRGSQGLSLVQAVVISCVCTATVTSMAFGAIWYCWLSKRGAHTAHGMRVSANQMEYASLE